jgi:hypothetical protein
MLGGFAQISREDISITFHAYLNSSRSQEGSNDFLKEFFDGKHGPIPTKKRALGESKFHLKKF